MPRRPKKSAFGPWFRSALLISVLIGTVDWALAISSSTGVGALGAGAGWVVIVSIWILLGSLWAILTGASMWAATGAASTAPIIDSLVAAYQKWWSERHDQPDATRLANTLATGAGLAAFGAGSVAATASIIEGRNVPWLIAAAALIAQVGLATAVLIAALALRRLLRAAFAALKRRELLPWLNTPVVLAAAALLATLAAVTAPVLNSELYFAVEGPALTLAAVAIIAHPLACYLLAGRLPLPKFAGLAIYAAPLLALLLLGSVSQHPEARRLVVLHGEAANFAFHTIHRHLDLDRFFHQSDCPPLGPDGRPVDGSTNEEYIARCMDPAYDRPTARQEVPEYDRPSFDQTPSFVFITWDSVRVDRLGFMGHHRDTTPNLDAFAERSLVFDRAFAADSGTGPSFWSLMAGKTPFQVNLVHGNRFPPPISDDEPMLGELLRDGGYRVEAVMCGSVFDRRDWGIRRGFASFVNVCGRELQEIAPMVTEQATSSVRRLAGRDEPFFLWVHYYDPHIPYNSHPDIGYGDSRIDRYDEELTYTDRHFAELIDVIDELSQDYDRPLFTIMSADHGENFNEHGTDPHARNLYRIVTQVPKIVHGPHIEPRRIDAPVALNDVYPTVLDLAGLTIPEETTMVSQVPVYFGADPDHSRMIFQENSYSRPRRHTRAVIYDRYHYIMDLTTNSDEFYDYVDDPLQQHNLIGTGLIEEQIMRQALARFLQTSTIPEGLED